MKFLFCPNSSPTMDAAAAAAPQCSSDFTPDELYVSQILLELPLLFHESHSSSLGLIPAWPLRRKRSALDSPPDTVAVAVKESSPTTPFSITSTKSPTESDENAKSSIKKPSLNKKSQYLEAIDELTKQYQVLEGNVEAMKQHFTHLHTINSELKLKKQEVILDSKKKSAIPEIGTSNSASRVVNFAGKSSSSTLDHHHHHHRHRHQNQNQFQASTKNQTVVPTAEQSSNFQIPIGGIPFYDPSSLGPMGIPDLNLSHEEINQRNYSRFLAARARQNRIQICKTKNNGAAKLLS